MIKRLFFLLCMTFCVMQSFAQYHIIGDVTGVDDGSMLYLTLVGREQQNIDSVKISKGHFEFTGTHVDKPLWALVKINNNFVSLADFYLEDGTIKITGERFSTRCTGTPNNEAYREYNDSIGSLLSEIGRVHYDGVLSKDSLLRERSFKVEKELEQLLVSREESFVKKYPSFPISVRVIEYRARNAQSKHIMTLLDYLAPELQTDSVVSELRNYALRLSKTEGGAIAPDFSLANKDGKKVSLSDFRGKYVLIDFWASWCAPCRASFPSIVKIYQKYKSRNFEIIGVSLDRSEKAWHKALSEETAPWVQLLDAKGFVAKEYAVMAIPHLVLISPEGKIIGSFDKAEIDRELVELFGN